MGETIEQKHAQMVAKLSKPGGLILEDLSAHKMEVLHMAVGICGEAGELIDIAKKYAIYNKDMNAEMHIHFIEELGDLEFYMQRLRQLLHLGRADILEANIKKLAVRYENFEYSDKAAHLRADKKP